MEKIISIDCARKFSTKEQLPSDCIMCICTAWVHVCKKHIICIYIDSVLSTYTLLLLSQKKAKLKRERESKYYAVYYVCWMCMSFWVCQNLYAAFICCFGFLSFMCMLMFMCTPIWLLYAKTTNSAHTYTVVVVVLRFSLKYLNSTPKKKKKQRLQHQQHESFCIHDISKIYYHIVKLKLFRQTAATAAAAGVTFTLDFRITLSFSVTQTCCSSVWLGWQLKNLLHCSDLVTIPFVTCSIYSCKFIWSHHFLQNKKRPTHNKHLHFFLPFI